MADITAQLVWYRLKNVGWSAVESLQSWAEAYEQFSWRRVELLDMFFLGWILLAFVVVGAVNLYLKLFGLPAFVRGREVGGGPGVVSSSIGHSNSTRGPLTISGGSLQRGGESAEWINTLLRWTLDRYSSGAALHLHVVDTWLKAFAEQANKYTDDTRLVFESIKLSTSGSSSSTTSCFPIQFTNVVTTNTNNGSSTTPNKDDLTIRANISVDDVRLAMSVITRTATNLQTETGDLRIIRLRAPVQITTRAVRDSICVEFNVGASADLSLQASSSTYSPNFNKGLIERACTEALGKLTLAVQLPGGELLSKPLSAGSSVFATEAPITRQNVQQSYAAHRSMIMVQKLLVKVIKANGLMDKDFAQCDPYLGIQMDEPLQEHWTSVVKNTTNPFFDEHFVFDFNNNTTHLQFSVYNKRIKHDTGAAGSGRGTGGGAVGVVSLGAPVGGRVGGGADNDDEFLGHAKVTMDDVRRLPSSRQIIPLTGRPKGLTNTSGSVTVEFLFMDVPVECTNEDFPTNDSISPYRRIETSHSLTPGGTLVTTTTTTTERLRDQPFDPTYLDSPTRVEKAETSSSYHSSRGGGSSPQPGGSRFANQSLTNGRSENLTEAALREFTRNSRSSPSGTTTVVISGVQRTTRPADDDYHYDADISGHRTTQKVNSGRRISVASQLKKRFSRSPKKDRSHSADKTQLFDQTLLRPDYPRDTIPGQRDEYSDDGTLPKPRSNSLSASFRNLFRRKKKHGNGNSRDSSTSRLTGADVSVASSTPQASPQALPKGTIARHNTPVTGTGAEGDLKPGGYMYSSSVPARPSPLYADH